MKKSKNQLKREKIVQLALTKKWEVVNCTQEDCWCAGISPVEKIYFDNEEEYIITPFGQIDRQIAERIVELHNKNLKDEFNICV